MWLFLFSHIWKIIPTAYEVFVGGGEHPMPGLVCLIHESFQKNKPFSDNFFPDG